MSGDSRLHDPLDWILEELATWDRAGLRRRLATRQGAQGARVSLSLRKLVDFSSNDYLGLAADRRVVAAAQAATEMSGWGSGSSPLITGRSSIHAELEKRLAEFENTEAALLFPSGFAANSGTIPALVGQRDAIYSDAKNHASIIDGCRLAGAKRFVYPHGDVEALATMLRRTPGFRRRLIVTDSLFSMDGDLARLEHLAPLAQSHGAMLMVDEAHATGVFGRHGRGVVEFLAEKYKLPHLHEFVHIRVGTLSKALGGAGGFVCGSQALIDWLCNRARSYVYSTAQPAAASAAALAALDILAQEPQRREELLQRAGQLRQRLAKLGFHIGHSESQIIPIRIGDAEQTMNRASQLHEAGFRVPGIRPPSVPAGQSQLRLSLCWHHTTDMIDGLVEGLSAIG